MWNKKATGTKHKTDCNMAFGRKDATCPRCIELINGAEVRTWAKSADQQRVDDIRSHYNSDKHKSGKCGVVCTFGEW